MLFDGDERTIYQEKDVLINQEKWAGTLFLTNKRIALERIQIKKSHLPIIGKDQKNEIISFVVPLTEVTNVIIVKKRLGRSVAFKISYSGRETQFIVNDPIVWENQILRAKSEIGPKGSGYGININVGTTGQLGQQTALTQTIERQVVKIRCSYCGSLYDEVLHKCPGCGARR